MTRRVRSRETVASIARSLLIGASVLLVSCASPSPKAGEAASPSAQALPVAATAVSAPTGAAPQAPAAAATTAPSGPAFADLIRSGKSATYKVTYRWTVTTQGKSDSSEQTWSFKPPKARMDWTSVDPTGTKSAFSFIEVETGSYMCGSGGGQNFCTKMDSGGVAGMNAALGLQEQFEADPGALAGATQSRRTIAGQQGNCYSVGGLQALNIASGVFCYSSSGVPLLLDWKQADFGWTMEATSFSTSVSDSDFALPAPPQ